MKKYLRLFVFGLVCFVLVLVVTVNGVGDVLPIESEEENDTFISEIICSNGSKEVYAEICTTIDEDGVYAETFGPAYSIFGEINSNNSTLFSGTLVENGKELCVDAIVLNQSLDNWIDQRIDDGWEYDCNDNVWFNGDKSFCFESDSCDNTVEE